MMDISHAQDDLYGLVLICPSTGRILVESMQGVLRVPRVSIPRYARVVEQLQLAIEVRWRIKAIIVDILADSRRSDRVALAEARGFSSDLGTASFVSLSDLDEDELSNYQREIVEQLLLKSITGRGPFSRLGWIEEASEWVSKEAALDRSEISCDVRQYSAGANFALIRFGLQGALPIG